MSKDDQARRAEQQSSRVSLTSRASASMRVTLDTCCMLNQIRFNQWLLSSGAYVTKLEEQDDSAFD
jgi:hypothetical protein